MAILTSEHYNAIRKAIDVNLDDTGLPDATIALDIYAGAAEREVLALDPNAESRTGAQLAGVIAGAVLLCAARLVPAVARVSSVGSGGESASLILFNPEKLAQDLRERSLAEISAVLAADASTSARPQVFTLARGRRGR